MTTPVRKKLIEVSLPLEAINAEARRRKQKAPKGYPTSIHKYWAQRPVAACRAVLFAQLVDDPSSWPEHFSGEPAIEAERKRLHDVIRGLVSWDVSGNNTVLDAARWEIARSVAWNRGIAPPPRDSSDQIRSFLERHGPTICDPFCGAGSIPLEAQRLGLKTQASDLNPVAVVITKALVEIPQRFSGHRSVNPDDTPGQRIGLKSTIGAKGLADDVVYYARLLRQKAAQTLASFYPDVELKGDPARTVAYFWVRTVRSPDPAARGAYVPLASSFLLSTKGGETTYVEPVIVDNAAGVYRFEVKKGVVDPAHALRIKAGTKASGRGSNFSCLLTGASITGDYIKSEGVSGLLQSRLMAIVIQTGRFRTYVAPDGIQEEAAARASSEHVVSDARGGWLSQPVPERLTGGTCFPYGLNTYDKLFTDRQILALTTFTDLLTDIREEIIRDALAADFPLGDTFAEGGSGASAYADAVATCLALSIGRMTLYGSSLCRWLTKDNALGSAIPQKGLEMTWDFAEANFLSDSSASLITCASNVSECLLSWDYNAGGDPKVSLSDARAVLADERTVWNTDPPYYDNIAYADLSDYFYVWHNRSLGKIWPGLYRRLSTNKQDELTALAYRERQPVGTDPVAWSKLDPKQKAEQFFFSGISQAFSVMQKNGDPSYPAIVYYAFRQQTESEEGTTSAGWSSVLQALIDSKFVIDGTWPLRTELTAALKTNINALASSIVLVCRKRPQDALFCTRTDFIRALKGELPGAIDAIRKAGVGPVDMQQAIIGPGMGVFSRYERVLEDDDSRMSVRTALAVINRVWEEIENELDQVFDPETQVALAWFSTYGFDLRASGELITLANAKNIPAASLFASGVFKDLRGKAVLTPRAELPLNWSPTGDKTLTTWECVQHTARVLNAADGGGEAAATLVAQMGPKAEEARALAYRLFEIATNKGWAAEALVYNELAQEWSKLEDRAATLDDTGRAPGPNQTTFAFDGSA
jgi:putative DNA methylase